MPKKLFFAIITALILINAAIISFLWPKPSTEPKINFQYVAGDKKFNLQFPGDWTIKDYGTITVAESPDQKSQFYIPMQLPLLSGLEAVNTENITIDKQNLKGTSYQSGSQKAYMLDDIDINRQENLGFKTTNPNNYDQLKETLLTLKFLE